MYTSINVANTSTINNIIETSVCLIISSFMFSLLLSFIIDLYNRMQLTAMQIITGIKIIFCKNIVVSKNIIPFCAPNTATADDTAYPMQNPLNITIPNTIGIPITVDPINHILIINIKLSQRELLSSSILFIWLSCFNDDIKLFMYS